MLAIAFTALFVWPIVVMQMFRRMPVERALIWSLMGGYLLLPPVVAIDLPVLPALDKSTIPTLTAFACLVAMRHKVSLVPRTPVLRVLLALFVLTPFGTVLTNQDPVIFGNGTFLPGLPTREVVSILLSQGVLLLPLFLGRAVLQTEAALKELVRAFFIGGLIYSLPILIEVRLSPQLNTWIYGFFQHSFDQMMRWGGFRPIVFLPHGLWVALYMLTALLCGMALMRYSEASERPRLTLAVCYLLVVLVLCKSMGALVYFVAFAPLLLLATRRQMLAVAAGIAVVVLAYPLLRGAGLVPVDLFIEQFERISVDRAGSLGFRLINEGLLLEHAQQRPVFGWGGWDRNLVHDPLSGRVTTISDGQWVIVIGIFGWSGYLVQFGLLTLPLVLLFLQLRGQGGAQVSPWLAVLAIVHAINLIDLIPNATLVPLTWLTCGALLAQLEARRSGVEPTVAHGLAAPLRPRTLI